jgi:hypothetical protein
MSGKKEFILVHEAWERTAFGRYPGGYKIKES